MFHGEHRVVMLGLVSFHLLCVAVVAIGTILLVLGVGH
jgi:hypothetical protein